MISSSPGCGDTQVGSCPTKTIQGDTGNAIVGATLGYKSADK